MSNKQFHIIRNFKNAFNGIFILLRDGKIFRVHLIIAALVIVAGFVLKIERLEWLIIMLTIGVVLSAEAFNTSLEKLSDHISPEYHQAIKKVKDMAAAAVLLASIAAAIIGLVIFIPYLFSLVK